MSKLSGTKNKIEQTEGNLIYPHVVGNSIGLPSIWVLVAVVIGGGTLGVPGIIIGIPLCSVLYSVVSAVINKRLVKINKNNFNTL